MTTDSDRARAATLVHGLSPEQYVDEFVYDGDVAPLIAAVAVVLAQERERAIEPFVALADEMQHQVNFRRETGPDVVADVREVDLQWLRLAISNAREPRQ